MICHRTICRPGLIFLTIMQRESSQALRWKISMGAGAPLQLISPSVIAATINALSRTPCMQYEKGTKLARNGLLRPAAHSSRALSPWGAAWPRFASVSPCRARLLIGRDGESSTLLSLTLSLAASCARFLLLTTTRYEPHTHLRHPPPFFFRSAFVFRFWAALPTA